MIPSRFIIVDNDPVNNLLCSLAIKDAALNADILAFTNPFKAFEYISAYNESNNSMNILLLDINMPIWSGWDFAIFALLLQVHQKPTCRTEKGACKSLKEIQLEFSACRVIIRLRLTKKCLRWQDIH